MAPTSIMPTILAEHLSKQLLTRVIKKVSISYQNVVMKRKYVASIGRDKITASLIKNGADVNLRDVEGWTALHLATLNGWLE